MLPHKRGNKKRKALDSIDQHEVMTTLLKQLELRHKGERILLKAAAIYSIGSVPHGEANYLFQYAVELKNEDCKTANLIFFGKFIEEGGQVFCNYPKYAEEDATIQNYSLDQLSQDHALFNEHLLRSNNFLKKEAEKEDKTYSLHQEEHMNETSDIFLKIKNR